jgi:hypothetical protein
MKEGKNLGSLGMSEVVHHDAVVALALSKSPKQVKMCILLASNMKTHSHVWLLALV